MVNKRNTNIDIKGALTSLEETAKEDSINDIEEKSMSGSKNINTIDNTDIKNNISDNIDGNINEQFIIKKRSDIKKDKKAFNIYMPDSLVKDLDKLGKKTGYSRNELINMMCDWCTNNYKVEE